MARFQDELELDSRSDRMNAAVAVLGDVFGHRRLLLSTMRVELMKRYAGSILGFAWVFLNPLLFLGVYVFLYLVVFKTTWPDMTNIGYTVFVFAGLVPFLSFMEVANGSVQLIRSNIHLVKNLVFPVALIPIRMALIGLVTQFVGLVMLLIMALIDGQVSWNILLLPYLIIIQFLLLVGIAFLCSGFGLLLPDFGYFLGSFLMLMLFLTPIGFKPGMVSGPIGAIVAANPFTYMVNAFRSALMAQRIDFVSIGVFTAISLAIFVLGAVFFRRLRAHLVDYE
jgi:lipopolysaccharide transport system permease protein